MLVQEEGADFSKNKLYFLNWSYLQNVRIEFAEVRQQSRPFYVDICVFTTPLLCRRTRSKWICRPTYLPVAKLCWGTPWRHVRIQRMQTRPVRGLCESWILSLQPRACGKDTASSFGFFIRTFQIESRAKRLCGLAHNYCLRPAGTVPWNFRFSNHTSLLKTLRSIYWRFTDFDNYNIYTF